MRLLLLIFITLMPLAIVSCSKDDKSTQQNTNQPIDKNQQDDNENTADTNLTPEEKFSSAIMTDFLDDSDDDDLADFLESEIYKRGESYNGAAVVGVTPSTWLVSFEKDGVIKNYLLQKYVDFKTNEYYFTFKETPLTITDIISQKKGRTSAGE